MIFITLKQSPAMSMYVFYKNLFYGQDYFALHYIMPYYDILCHIALCLINISQKQ